MKKQIIFLLLSLISLAAISQNKVLQYQDKFYVYNSAVVSPSTYCDGDMCTTYLIAGSDTLCDIYENGVTFWKSALTSSNVSDTLAGTGVASLCRITIPTNITTQRIIQLNDVAIIYSSNAYYKETSASIYNSNVFPIKIKQLNNNALVCTIYESGIIDWNLQLQYSWMGRVGTTRIKRITLP